MGHDVEFDVMIFNAETFFDFLFDIAFFFFDKAIKFFSGFDNIPAPIIIELKAGEMAIALIHIPTFTELLVTIATDTQYAQNIGIGI